MAGVRGLPPNHGSQSVKGFRVFQGGSTDLELSRAVITWTPNVQHAPLSKMDSRLGIKLTMHYVRLWELSHILPHCKGFYVSATVSESGRQKFPY